MNNMIWGEKILQIARLCCQQMPCMPPNFAVKSFKKTSKFTKIFSLESFPYTYGKYQQVAKTSEYYVATSQ